MILLCRSLVLTSSSSLQTAAGRGLLFLFFSIVPIIAMEWKYRPASLSQWQTLNLIKTHITLTLKDPYTCIHTYTSLLPSRHSKFEYSVQGLAVCWHSAGGLLSKGDWKRADGHLGKGRKHFRVIRTGARYTFCAKEHRNYGFSIFTWPHKQICFVSREQCV